MPMYPYRIPTTFGLSFPFDTETNISEVANPGSIILLHHPGQGTLDSKRAIVAIPIEQQGLFLTDNGLVPKEELQHLYNTQIGSTNNGTPIFFANPQSFSAPNTKFAMYSRPVKMMVPSADGTLIIGAIVLLILAVAFLLYAIGIIAGGVEQYLKQMHEMDLALQAQQVDKYSYIDTDTGETKSDWFDGADVEERTYHNGEVLDVALNQTGKDFLGGYAQTVRQGIDMQSLFDQINNEDNLMNIIKWVVIGVVAIGGVYIAVKVIPGLIGRKQQPYYYPPPAQY